MSAACTNVTTSLHDFLSLAIHTNNTSTNTHTLLQDFATCSGAEPNTIPPLLVFVVFLIIGFFIYIINTELKGYESSFEDKAKETGETADHIIELNQIATGDRIV